MEVKVIQQTKSLHYGGNQTHIFECIAVTHEIIEYKDRENLLGIYSDRTAGINGFYVLGIPGHYWETDAKDLDPGQVLLISMDRGQEVELILCKDCRVYITTKGQTLDTISI